jgi:hypothetical protein
MMIYLSPTLQAATSANGGDLWRTVTRQGMSLEVRQLPIDGIWTGEIYSPYGWESAGKIRVVSKLAQHLSPRESRVVDLGKLSHRDRRSWCFQRYVPHFPSDRKWSP